MTSPRDISALFVNEAAALKRFLRKFGGDLAIEDIAQDSFVRICVDPNRVQSPRALLFATARNLAIDNLRRAKAAPMRSVAEIDLARSALHSPSPEDARIAADQADALRKALAALPDLQRRALLMRRVEKRPPAEVARELGVTERRVQRLVLKAIAFCHARLTDSGDNTPPNR